MTPARLTRPCDGAIPTMLLLLAGLRIEAPVSVAMARVAKPDIHGHTGARARSSRIEPRVVGIRDLSAEGAQAFRSQVELVEVGLEEDDRSRVLQLLHDGGIVLGEGTREREVPAGGGDVFHVDGVLDRDRECREAGSCGPSPPALGRAPARSRARAGSWSGRRSASVPSCRRPRSASGTSRPAARR